MISLYYETEDRFKRYGIQHFIEKFGIPVRINKSSQSGIVISYGCQAIGDFVISIEENKMGDTVCGRISKPAGNVFICETPRDVGSTGNVLAIFENDSTQYPCVVRKKQGIDIGIDIFRETGYLLSGHLDTIRHSLDSSTKNTIASQSCVDFLENILFESILDGCKEQKIPLVQKSYWPCGKLFAVCLTHDVDEIKKTSQWISHPLRYARKMDFRGLNLQFQSLLQKIKGIEPYDTFKDIINIENEYHVKSTFFILRESGSLSISSKKTWNFYGRNRSFQGKHFQNILRDLKTNGNEIGIHGSFFSHKNPILLKEETRELEQIINEKVIGTRQHYLNLDVPATWNYQEEAGLRYDSTLGFNDTIGFRWGTSFPFFPNTGEVPHHLLEIPLIIMDICLVPGKRAIPAWLPITNEVEQYQGVLTLLWHPPIFNVLEYPEFRGIYIDIIQHCQKKEAWITRARDIYEWLSLRNQQSFSSSYSECTCSITPSGANFEHYFTIYLPPGTNGTIHSGNAEVIRREGDSLYIKTNRLSANEKIIIGIT